MSTDSNSTDLANGRNYGDGDASFQTAGGEPGIRQLVDAFYNSMESLSQAAAIRAMHPDDLLVSRDKLTLFLCGWLGGPKLFREKYGPIQIPHAHKHLVIGSPERDAWLACMQQALAQQNYPQLFQDYLMREFFRPADRSRTAD
ncbi:MAG: hemoglobin [Oceanicoccus sp.]|jgi:hemoglobin